MPNPVSIVTIHHEGAGSCTDTNYSRYSEGGYTYGIGCTNWTHFRDVWSSYATLNRNGESVDVCVSGNRMVEPFTQNDVALIGQAVADAKARGYVIANPEVVAHRNSPGSSTVCPGDNTMKLWDSIVAACTGAAPAPVPPSPSPVGSEAPLTTVASPHSKAGRQGTARPIPAFGTVALDNGARCEGDTPSGDGYVWLNPDKTVQQLHAPLLDIAATVGSDGKPNGDGFVALYDLDGDIATYVVPWR